jgi:hypothetical protein
MIGPYACCMRKPVLVPSLSALLAALALPLLLGSCSTISSVISQDAKVDSAGPLEVGKPWTLTGAIDSGTVNTSIPVKALYNVVGGSATVADRDQLSALEAGERGFSSAAYLTDSVNTLKFIWLGDAVGGVVPRYTCTITSLLQAPYAGVLVLQRGGNTYRGTCTASST